MSESFRDKLVLNAWMIGQFGYVATPTTQAKQPIRELTRCVEKIPEGLAEDGLHRFYHVFAAALPATAPVSQDELKRYEENIVTLTARLNAGRDRPFAWKYFQWLTLLFVERYLDRFFSDRHALLDDLNSFVGVFNTWRQGKHYTPDIAPFAMAELNKLCLQNATGSGKTLLMHANLLQFRRHAQDAKRLGEYTRALLLTPNEDLTAQHLNELAISGIGAQRFVPDLLATAGSDLARVDALELSKLAETDGDKTIAVRNFGDANLLLVDEGHVGLDGNKESGFMARRNALSARGFVFEYSATFAQAVSAANNEEVTQSYAKSVLFDYSYRYFYEDGYGKDYQVFNLAGGGYDDGQTENRYLTACLLAFYQQLRVYAEQKFEFAAFNLEKPLWVCVGSSVTKAIGGTQQDTLTSTDVEKIVNFIAHVLHNPVQCMADMASVLNSGTGNGLVDAQGNPLFAASFGYLHEKLHKGETVEQLYVDVLTRVFGGSGALSLKRPTGEGSEIRLHAGSTEQPFGLINVGDAPGLLKRFEGRQDIRCEDSLFASGAIFRTLNDAESPVNVLIGSRKFISGWDCWRVSMLGLMNIGRGEGSQIIQLFGRGVRLKGKDWSLKRSSALPHVTPPPHIQVVETLGVFGVKADYMQSFRQMLKNEGLEDKKTCSIPMNVVYDFGKQLMILAPKTKRADGREYDFALDGALPVLDATVPEKLKQTPVRVDCYPRIQATVAGDGVGDGQNKNPYKLTHEQLAFIDWDAIWLALEQYKRLRGWTHLVIDRASLPRLFHPNYHGWYSLLMPPEQVKPAWGNVPLWRRVVQELLKRYVEAFYNHHKKAFFEPRLELQPLTENHANLQVEAYRLTVEATETLLIQDIEKLAEEIEQNQGGIVPNAEGASVRAAMAGMQLLKPMLHVRDKCPISVTPVPLNGSEFDFVRDLHAFVGTDEGKQLLDGTELFLLRNKARGGGIGFFEAGAFYPDFIVWMVRGGKQHVVFIEPHGLKHEERDGLKIRFFETIKHIERRVNEGRADYIALDSFIASPTLMSQLKWGDDWQGLDAFGQRHVLMMKDEPKGYVGRMFRMLLH